MIYIEAVTSLSGGHITIWCHIPYVEYVTSLSSGHITVWHHPLYMGTVTSLSSGHITFRWSHAPDLEEHMSF
jgi:hypothetical protein